MPRRKTSADDLFPALNHLRALGLILYRRVNALSEFPLVSGGIEQKDFVREFFTNSVDRHGRNRNALLKRFQ